MALLPLLQQLGIELHSISLLTPFLILLVSLVLLKLFVRGDSGDQNLPPSPPKLPIIGNAHQLGKLPHRALQKLSVKYGPLMLLKLGQKSTLVVSSADMAREMMKTHDIAFSNRPFTVAAYMFSYQAQDVALSPYGEYWRQVRKICVIELLSPKRVQSLKFVREEELEIMMNKIRQASVRGDAVNLSEMLVSVSNNITSMCVFGRKAEEENGRSRLGELSRRLLVQFMAFNFTDMYNWLGWMDVLTGFMSSIKETFCEFDAYIDQMLEEHKSAKDDQSDRNKDFLHILLQLQETGRLDIELTRDNIKAILLDMLVAGTDTTSTTLEWMISQLINNPTTMKRAQEEVRRVMGNKSKIDETDINQMEYLKCVVKETLRLHAPVPLSSPRETSARVEMGGYTIPPKTRVLVNIWAIQREPELWNRPEEFIPERFENNSVDFKGKDFQFIPFGGGRRGCPGLTFGVVAVEFLIANLLYWFNWNLPGGSKDNLDMSEVYGLTVTKKVPLVLMPQLYTP